MKRFIIRIIIFFFIVLGIDIVTGLVFDYLNAHAKSGTSKRMYSLCIKDKHDVIIMGSSRALYHYVPEIFEDTLKLDCYNAGFGGNGILLQYGILEMFSERYTPKLIIYDIEPLFDIYEYTHDNNDTRYLRLLKPYYRQPSISQIFKDVSTNEYIKVHSGLCRYNSDILSILASYFRGEEHDIYKGYIPMGGELTREVETSPVSTMPVIDPVKQKYLISFIKIASEHKIPLLVIASPRYGMNSSAIFDDVKRCCEECNIPFWDYYTDPRFVNDKTLFRDFVHLNDKGARSFSRLLASDIKNDKRSNNNK